MTGKEIVNLIEILQNKGVSSGEIIEIIKYVVLNDPQTSENAS